MKPPPRMEMEHKTDISEQWILEADMVYSMFPLNQGAEGNDFKDPKSGETQQDKGFHTSCHPILRG